MKLTEKQLHKFWAVFRTAWANIADQRGLDVRSVVERDAYRREVLMTATGQPSLKLVNRTRGYDKLMEIIANDAEDYEAAIHYGLAGERRARELSADCLRQIAEITGRPDIATSDERWLYVADLITHAWRRDDWLDLSEDQLARVFMMLDTYRRRLLKAAGWLGTKEDGRPLAYAYGTHYIRESDGTVGIRHVLTTVKPEASHA